MVNPEQRNSAQRAARPWRAAFVVYALALTTGTHWPQLDLGVGDMPAPDKILHMLGFAGLAFLLWRTRWVRRIRVMLPVLLVWALLDEITQAIPILGRSFSLLDVLAGWMGIVVVMAWAWALQPVGGPLSQMRSMMVEFVIDEMFQRPRTWVLTGVAGALGAVMFGWPATLIDMPQMTLVAVVVAGVMGGGAASLAVLDVLWRRQRNEIVQHRQCDQCGFACRAVRCDHQGHGRCPQCEGAIHAGQWRLLAKLPRRAKARSIQWGVVAAGVALIFVVIVYVLLAEAAVHTPWLMMLLDSAAGPATSRIPADLRLVIDLSVIGLLLAWATRIYRQANSRVLDRQHRQCMACGHDVHATPDDGGVGHCGECGGRFVRAAPYRDYAVNG